MPRCLACVIDEENFPGERRHGFGLRKNSKGTESEAALKEGTLFFANTIEEPTGKTDGPADDAGKGRRDDEMQSRSVMEA